MFSKRERYLIREVFYLSSKRLEEFKITNIPKTELIKKLYTVRKITEVSKERGKKRQ
jgi:hypothetical protein